MRIIKTPTETRKRWVRKRQPVEVTCSSCKHWGPGSPLDLPECGSGTWGMLRAPEKCYEPRPECAGAMHEARKGEKTGRTAKSEKS